MIITALKSPRAKNPVNPTFRIVSGVKLVRNVRTEAADLPRRLRYVFSDYRLGVATGWLATTASKAVVKWRREHEITQHDGPRAVYLLHRTSS
jgi:hypothetical protein